MKDSEIKQVLRLATKVKASPIDVVNLYEELIVSEDIDTDLDKTHVMYSFCVILAEEFNYKAEALQAELDKWSGEKWRKLKSSTKLRYTDNDAKRKIESTLHYMKQTKLIAKYRKLHKQLAFGGAKALEIKANNIRQKIYRAHRAFSEDFSIRNEELKESIGPRIQSRLKKER
jgi:hypothetical protein